MSSRNSKTAKAAARERLRIQREKEAKRAKIRRQVMVGVGVLVVLGAAAGIAVAVNQANKPAYWENAAKQKLVVPAHASGKDGLIIVVGDKNNKNVVHEYEDPRCPYCAAYEQTAGAAVLQGAKEGKYQINYSFAAFIDNNGGSGSRKALSAMGAALNVSLDAFEQYHTLLYSKAVHPEETNDAFGSGDKLISLAQQVPALKGNAKFSDAVKKGTFDKWALTVRDAYNKDSASTKGTPYVLVNGTSVKVIGLSADQVMTGIESQLKK